MTRAWLLTGFILILAGLYLQDESYLKTVSDPNRFSMVDQRESLYGWVRVLDNPDRNMRLLSSDASVIGAATLSSGENLLAYQQIVERIPRIHQGIHRALIVGQGAGHMALNLKNAYGIVTDTIEIDPAVDDFARRYFGFSSTGDAYIGDGRYLIRKLQNRYDLIIHDCFTGGAEPAHLLTVEALAELSRLLTDQGILALNFVGLSTPGRNRALASVSKTFRHVFHVYEIYASEPGNEFNDFILIGGGRLLHDGGNARTDDQEWLSQRRYHLDDRTGYLLTDDYNPIESLQLTKSETYRRLVRDWLGFDLMMR